jgi:hypothetical protein
MKMSVPVLELTHRMMTVLVGSRIGDNMAGSRGARSV